MKYSLNTAFTDLNDKPILDGTGEQVMLNKFLANSIFNNDAKELGKPVDVYQWALDLNKTGFIELSEKERDSFVNYITENATMTVGIKGQLIKCFQTPIE